MKTIFRNQNKFLRTLSICVGFLPVVISSQNFNYTVSCDSTGTYQELTTKTCISNDTLNWNFVYKKAIGFSFLFLGKNFDTLRIEKNNYIVFDNNRNYALMAFPGFSCKKDSQNHYSCLAYNLSGATPDRILKLQFRRVGQTEYPSEYISYQVWLHENGAIDIYMGDHTYNVPDSTNYNDTLNTVQIGLINTNMDTETRGLFLKGSATQPTGQPIDDNNTDISFMRSFARPGTRYTFTPQSN